MNVISRIIYFLILVNIAKSESFSAISEFQKLVFVENNLLSNLRNFISIEKENLDYLEKKFQKLQLENDVAIQDPLSYSSNPLNSFLITQRLTTDVSIIESRMAKIFELFSNIFINFRDSNLISEISEDKENIVRSIAHLQSVYKLNAKDLIQGEILGKKFREPLDIKHVIEIGVLLGNLSLCENSLEWLKEAIPLVENEKIETAEKSKFFSLLTSQFLKCGNVEDIKHLYSYLDTKKVSSDTSENIYTREYNRMCSGSVTNKLFENPNLSCFYVTNSTYTRLFQYKAELLNIDPPVYIFYDVIADNEIEELKNLSQKSLQRAGTTPQTDEVRYDFVRTSKCSSFGDSYNELIASLSKRIERFTGLSMETSEGLQVQNYGVAGHYMLHGDYMEDKYDGVDGDRIATFMFYLSDVETGGATVFPVLNLSVEPTKGAAIFWYNLHRSLAVDRRTLHAGCPVVIGSKWVATKWIRSKGQIFRRPCGLEDDDSKFNLI